MEHDYIVVGAGSAGAALAARLSARPDVRVLLVEAGGRAEHWSVHMPLGYYINYAGGPFNWAYHSTPQAELGGRRIYHPRGRGLGGSSAINGMAFLRGHPLDYDRWQAEGAAGWSYADVLPVFKRMETSVFGETELRGGHGPLAVTRATFPSAVSEAFIRAGAEAGFRLTDDFNGGNQEGFGRFDQTIDNGTRASTAHAYLKPARNRPNLEVATGRHVAGLILSNGRANGVRIVGEGGVTEHRCTREVILSAGAFGSPQILMLSGIGPADHLNQIGVPVMHDLPGVGSNLQDHLEAHISWEGPLSESLNRFAGPLRRTLAGAQWFLTRGGVCAFNGALAGAFTRSGPGIAHPDIQYHFFPFYLDGLALPAGQGGFCICVGTLRARSRGTVRLASTDPVVPPHLDFRYLSEAGDLEDLRLCVRQAREVAMQPALAPFRQREQEPWRSAKSDSDIDRLIRERAESAYHPCGTCRMGSGEDAVVDPQCRVRGIEGLRIADASIFPSITSGNLNAPSIMIGERAADLILGEVG